MMLYHDRDYKVVKSSVPLIGMIQHDIGTWQLDGAIPVVKDELSIVGKIQDVAFAKILDDVEEEYVQAFRDVFNNCLEATGTETLTAFVKHIVPSVPKIFGRYYKHDKPTRKNFWKATTIILTDIAKTAVDAVKGDMVFPSQK